MKLEDSKIRVHTSPVMGSFLIDVTIYIDHGNELSVARIENGEMLWTQIKAGEDFKPSFRMPVTGVPLLAAGFVEYARKSGLPEPTKDFAEGKIQATERHLQDMRRLVFEEKEIINVEEKRS